jgi:carbon-monoxide dehydrogenase small subunit
MSACLLPAVFVDGADVTTIEGLAMADGTLSPLQDAFIRTGGFQCGICTPGQIVAATALLAEDPTPDEPTTREWMKGNLCRCTGYDQIVEAIVGVGR